MVGREVGIKVEGVRRGGMGMELEMVWEVWFEGNWLEVVKKWMGKGVEKVVRGKEGLMYGRDEVGGGV